MNFRRRTAFAFALLLLALPAAAAELSPKNAETLRTRFEQRQQATRTWSARFTQSLQLPGLRTPIVSVGTFRYRAPDQLRIDFTQPAGEFVLVVGDRLFLRKSGRPVSEKSLSADSAGRPFAALLGLMQGRPAPGHEQFTQRVLREGDRYVVELRRAPGGSQRLPRAVTTEFASDSFELRQLFVELPRGGAITYRFENSDRNVAMDAGLFAIPSR